MKRVDGTDVWTDGVNQYKKNTKGDFELYVESEDNWTYSQDDFVTVDEPVVLKPVDNAEKE